MKIKDSTNNGFAIIDGGNYGNVAVIDDSKEMDDVSFPEIRASILNFILHRGEVFVLHIDKLTPAITTTSSDSSYFTPGVSKLSEACSPADKISKAHINSCYTTSRKANPAASLDLAEEISSVIIGSAANESTLESTPLQGESSIVDNSAAAGD